MAGADENTMLLNMLSVVATLSTVSMFLIGIPICAGVVRRRTSEGISIAPYAMCVVSCFFWLQYGILKRDRIVILINLIGFCLEVVYFFVLYMYSRRKSSLHALAGAMTAICACLVYYLRLNARYDSTLDRLGTMCLILNVLNFASPLAVLREVMETKSTELLPKPIIIVNLLVSAQWYLYGHLVGDPYMKIPNMIGHNKRHDCR
uniref:Sugar transporter SWEET1 n=1 Tax=Trichuris muris TaxID=70415 RepID=A0A5S6QIC5_TRIMR